MSKFKLCIGASIIVFIIVIVTLGVGCRHHWWGGNLEWCSETTTLAEDLGRQMKNTSNLLISEAGNLIVALLEETRTDESTKLTEYQTQLLQTILHTSMQWNGTKCEPTGQCYVDNLEEFCNTPHPFIFKN